MKIMKPTTTLPPSTKSPNALIICPEEPIFDKIFLVVDTLIPSRNNVVISSSDGKIENSNGSWILIVITRIIIDNAMLITIATSTSPAGNGIINSRITVSTKSTTE